MSFYMHFGTLRKLQTNLILAVLFLGQSLFAQILSPNAKEVNFNYEATVIVPVNADYMGPLETAKLQASYMFGIFSSPTQIRKAGLNPNKIGGLGAPQNNMAISILATEEFTINKVKYIRIRYQNSGQIIFHKKAADKFLAQGKLKIPLPINPYKVYRVKCTDPHYTSFGDYWYFYDPYRAGCEHLSQAPLADSVTVQITPAKARDLQRSAELPLLRSDNGNRNLFSIDMIHGFSEDKKDPHDEGRINFFKAHNFLISEGFNYEKLKSNQSYPFYSYTKDVTLSSGESIHIQIRSLLVETSIGSRSKIFAQFFKEAVEKADVIIYEGHSGLGGNLNIPALEAKAGQFKFPKKKQIYLFDSCSSYSYYLDHFSARKTKTNIDVITFGLPSYFNTAPLVLKEFLKYLISSDNRNFQWLTILNKLESVLDKETSLINVGGI